ncbi:hypothetical protein L1887_14048 [Cichorium endivia]|nr:hypothetical protein L1887_14048 [Cichorium endivia]
MGTSTSNSPYSLPLEVTSLFNLLIADDVVCDYMLGQQSCALYLSISHGALNGRLRAVVDKASKAKIVGMTVGGQDLICVKQKPSSTIPPSELRGYLDDLGDSLFSNGRSPSLIEMKTRDDKQKIPDVFNRMLQPHTMQFINITETSSKDGLTVIECKRGRDVFSESHSKWLQTVGTNPEAMVFKFVPITSLLNGIPGTGYLSHAINLYLRSNLPDNTLQTIEALAYSFCLTLISLQLKNPNNSLVVCIFQL